MNENTPLMQCIFEGHPVPPEFIASYNHEERVLATGMNGEKAALYMQNYDLFKELRSVSGRPMFDVDDDVFKLSVTSVCTPFVEWYLNVRTQMGLDLPRANVDWFHDMIWPENMDSIGYSADSVIRLLHLILPLVNSKQDLTRSLLNIAECEHDINIATDIDIISTHKHEMLRATDVCYKLVLRYIQSCHTTTSAIDPESSLSHPCKRRREIE